MSYRCISECTRSRPWCISIHARSRPASAFRSGDDPSIQVHLETHSIMASKCISKLTRSRPPSASLGSPHSGLEVHLRNRCILTSNILLKKPRRVYFDTRVTQVYRATGSIQSADPGVDRHHRISISSYQTMNIHTLSFPILVPLPLCEIS